MNPNVFNTCMLAGLLLCGAGAWVQFGLGVALLVAGGLLLALSLTTLLVVRCTARPAGD